MHTLCTLTCACANTHVSHAQVLDYWRHFNDGYGAEEPDLFEVVPPRFGRLLAFDGRLPHGVRRVTGPQAMANGNSVEHTHSVDSIFVEAGHYFKSRKGEKEKYPERSKQASKQAEKEGRKEGGRELSRALTDSLILPPSAPFE